MKSWRRAVPLQRAWIVVSIASVIVNIPAALFEKEPWFQTYRDIGWGLLAAQMALLAADALRFELVRRRRLKEFDRHTKQFEGHMKVVAAFIRKTMGVEYMVSRDGSSIMCMTCGRVSWNPNDVREKFCGNCHRYMISKERLS